jgi:thiol-disulfide isomerase/thioredoxin
MRRLTRQMRTSVLLLSITVCVAACASSSPNATTDTVASPASAVSQSPRSKSPGSAGYTKFDVRAAVGRTRGAQTAIVRSEFAFAANGFTDRVAVSGPADLRDDLGFALLSDEATGERSIIRDGSLFVGNDTNRTDTPIANHNQFAGAVAGAPTSPLALLESLEVASWQTGASSSATNSSTTYNVDVSTAAALETLKFGSTATLSNRSINRVVPVDSVRNGQSNVEVTVDDKNRITMVALTTRFKDGNGDDGVASVRTTYEDFGVAFEVPAVRPSTPVLRLSGSGLALDETTFDDTVASSTPTIVIFQARWCPYCHQMVPLLSQASLLYTRALQFGAVDVDADPVLSRRFRVSTVPTVIAFRSGRQIGTYTGGLEFSEVVAWLGSLANR